MSETEAKTNPASAQKLRKQREKGSIAAGSEVSGLLGCAAGLLMLAAMAAPIWRMLSASIIDLATLQEAPIRDILEVGIALVGSTIFFVIAPLIGIIFTVGFVTAMLFNGGFLFTLHPVKPQLSRLSMKKGISRIYGRRGWLEFGVSSVRLLVWLMLAGFILFVWVPEFLRSPVCGIACMVTILHPLAWIILTAAIVIMLIASLIEAVIQKNQFLHEQKMTKSEVKRESKDQHGSPEVRRERSRLRNKSRQPYSKPGAGRGNLCFYTGQKAIILRYQPSEEQEIFVVAKVHGADAVANTRRRIDRPGVYQSEEPELVTRIWPHELGDPISPENLDFVAAAMRKIFSR